MNKFGYLLWPLDRMDPSARRRILLDETAPKLLETGIDGLQINIADDRARVRSPAPNWPWLAPAFVAQVNLWTDDPAARERCETLLAEAGFRLAGYRFDEWLYTDYGDHPTAGSPRNWPDGERSPGILAVTLIRRPPRVPPKLWMQRWFGRQSPMSEWMQPRARYVRNLVSETVTADAPPLDGVVEEAWPTGEHVTNPYLFYGASNPFQLIRHMAIMLRSVTSMLSLLKIRTVMMSEYFVRSV